MVKLLENTSQTWEYCTINELAMLCKMLDIDIWEVVDAAKTKPFGFQSFRPIMQEGIVFQLIQSIFL